MDNSALADPTCRDQMKLMGEARTQTFARQLVTDGYSGLIVKSFAPGAAHDDLNCVIWKWGSAAPSSLILIDDESRLSH